MPIDDVLERLERARHVAVGGAKGVGDIHDRELVAEIRRLLLRAKELGAFDEVPAAS